MTHAPLLSSLSEQTLASTHEIGKAAFWKTPSRTCGERTGRSGGSCGCWTCACSCTGSATTPCRPACAAGTCTRTAAAPCTPTRAASATWPAARPASPPATGGSSGHSSTWSASWPVHEEDLIRH